MDQAKQHLIMGYIIPLLERNYFIDKLIQLPWVIENLTKFNKDFKDYLYDFIRFRIRSAVCEDENREHSDIDRNTRKKKGLKYLFCFPIIYYCIK